MLFPNIRADLKTHKGDWAAQGFWAMVVYRFGRWRYGLRPKIVRMPFSLLYKILFKLVQVVCGIQMPCEAPVGRNFRIDPHLYLLHFGMVDAALCAPTLADPDRHRDGWAGHLDRRKRLFDIITHAKPREADAYFPRARRWQTWVRPLTALNKPAMIPGNPVVRLPERFRGLV